MPLISFSEPGHISKLLSGTKRQTTRPPRKNPLKVGDVLYCYYKSRIKKMCSNCISDHCKIPVERRSVKDLCNFPPCDHHNNYFGEAKVIGILHCNNVLSMNGNRLCYAARIQGKEFEKWIEGFDCQSKSFMNDWAKADGFLDYREAHEWFAQKYKSTSWMIVPWDIIIFKPLWIK
jgi:hypothetical protein